MLPRQKLVRDKIPSIIKRKGERAIYYIASGQEYLDRLNDKLLEEIGEFNTNPCVEEMGDILEVLQAIAMYHGLTTREIAKAKTRKAIQKGSFLEGYVLEID